MKTLLKAKVNADQTSQANGLNAASRVTRQSTASGVVKVELVDPSRKMTPIEIDKDRQPKPQASLPPMQATKRNFGSTFTTPPPVYTNSVTIQSDDGVDMDDSYSGSSTSGTSYTQPPNKKMASSVLRNTLSGPTDVNSGRTKNRPGRKPTKAVENMSEEEFRRLEDRRVKNKEAAQRCRSRRLERIQELEEKIKGLNHQISSLQATYDKYKGIPNQLQYYLNSSNHVCLLAATPPATTIPMSSILTGSDRHNQGSSEQAQHSNVEVSRVESSQNPGSAVLFGKPINGATKLLHSPTSRNPAAKRPQFLNKPINNIIAEQKRPSSQPSPSVALYPGFFSQLGTGTPGHSDFLNSPSAAAAWASVTPQLPSFGGNIDGFFMDDRTPSRDMASALCNALDLQTYPVVLETPNTENPKFTAL